jgi:hypothetical protein
VSSRVSLLRRFSGGGGGSGAALRGHCGSLLFLRLGVGAGAGGLVGVFLWCSSGSFCFVMGDLVPLLDCYLHSRRRQLQVVASPVFTDAVTADARSTSEVCHGVSMTSIPAAFPMPGAACRS